ncbi:toprim domain-containing protein [Caldifermentibacillus hisashii]|uniref:toprim domain-containing protein n=1 Tax=Caldifermentibacillus hisashii TaxID=996558 RepID=UPI001C11A122|nr:toprim domain-containing protein [Caldifermentibacillus hisashii]MBU5341257.1 toprim domain-containing protein [Caldifermentibacillus hisashii]
MIDVESELREFEWVKPRWTADKLIAASPFRYDKTPSFMVRLQPYGKYPAGVWTDSGAYDEEWRSGNFVKLLSFLRNETYEETEEYLRTKYMVSADGDIIVVQPKLKVKRYRQALNLTFSQAPVEYLKCRGIDEEVQRMFGVGFDPKSNAVILPWRLPDGRLANVKYRKTYGKAFWYERGGWPIRELVYGMDLIYSRQIRRAAIVEAEIDAMSMWTAGMPAVAVGGSTFNAFKRDVILRSPIEELVIATDNDKPGERLRAEVERELGGLLRIGHKRFVGDVKDANEALLRHGAYSLKFDGVFQNAIFKQLKVR